MHKDAPAQSVSKETSRSNAGEIPSRILFQEGEREVLITHAGQSYRLSITRQNKLILTK